MGKFSTITLPYLSKFKILSITYQVPVVGVVRIGDEHMPHVVQVPVVGAVAADEVGQHVDAGLLVEALGAAVGLRETGIVSVGGKDDISKF
jgi:hypothetical protein